MPTAKPRFTQSKTVRETELVWVQPKLMRQEYELQAGSRVVATLRWLKRFGSLAEAECEGSRWTYKRGGFLRPRVTVREAGKEQDLAILEPGWLGNGELQFVDGPHCLWRRNFWQTQCTFLSSSNEEMVRFAPKSIRLKQRVTVEVSRAGAAAAELPILLTLGLYLIVLMSDDASAAVAITAAS
jgi:hypothetical protein